MDFLRSLHRLRLHHQDLFNLQISCALIVSFQWIWASPTKTCSLSFFLNTNGAFPPLKKCDPVPLLNKTGNRPHKGYLVTLKCRVSRREIISHWIEILSFLKCTRLRFQILGGKNPDASPDHYRLRQVFSAPRSWMCSYLLLIALRARMRCLRKQRAS